MIHIAGFPSDSRPECLADTWMREVVMARNGGGGQSGGSGEDRGGSSPDRSPNDDRSDASNPTSDAYDADQENRADQAERGW